MNRSFFIYILASFLGVLVLPAQSLTLIDTVNFPGVSNSFGDVGGSDCWGWTDPNGVDYAIMGTYYGTAYVRASDRLVCAQVPGPQNQDPYYHRDIKTYKHYAYLVAEMTGTNEGVQIVDLSPLPDSVRIVGSYLYTDTAYGLQATSHNISIDTATGYAYVLESGARGVRIIDLSNPEAPVEAGFLEVSNVHDVYVRNDTAWVAEGWSFAYSVYDLSNKSNPSLILRITDPGFGYAHNIWPSDDGRYFITTEETDNKTVKIWDMTNPSNVVMRDEYLAPCSLAHNAQVMGDYVFFSHYESGVTVVDISDPNNITEVADYDTYPASDNPDFLGCWGAFPYSANGWVYASNFDGTLFFLKWDAMGTGLADGNPETRLGLTAYPNPFGQGQQNISFTLDKPGAASVSVYNMQGKMVRSLSQGNLAAGKHSLKWDGRDEDGRMLPVGIYQIALNTGKEMVHLSVILVD